MSQKESKQNPLQSHKHQLDRNGSLEPQDERAAKPDAPNVREQSPRFNAFDVISIPAKSNYHRCREDEEDAVEDWILPKKAAFLIADALWCYLCMGLREYENDTADDWNPPQ